MFDQHNQFSRASTAEAVDRIPTLPTDGMDDLPIAAVMRALSGREPTTTQRRLELELAIRTQWASLTRLVLEYNKLAARDGTDPLPDVTQFAMAGRSLRNRSMTRPRAA